MTITLAVDSSNDLYLDDDGNIAMASGIEAALQICEHVSKTRLGEIYLNTDVGIPFFETVYVATPNLQQFEASVRAAILEVPDVVSISSFTTALNENILSYTITIVTIYGEGVISG